MRRLYYALATILVLLIGFPAALATPTTVGAVPVAQSTGAGPSIEQQIDILDVDLTTTSTTYTDASGSGSFLWNSARYSGLQHVYFEAGIGNKTALHTTSRIRSADILSALVSGSTYKARIKYGCTYNSSLNTFTETGYAELWSSDGTIEVTSSAVSNSINTGSGTCPTTPSTVSVRFSRLIILQSNPAAITDTDTAINIGHNETHTLADTNDHPLASPKIWTFTDHNLHPAAGWDSIKDVLFSATIASPKGTPVFACLYDITKNVEVTCVSTSATTPTYVVSLDVTTALQDGDQYETYQKAGSAATSVALYNSFVTVQQSSSTGIAYVRLYYDLECLSSHLHVHDNLCAKLFSKRLGSHEFQSSNPANRSIK